MKAMADVIEEVLVEWRPDYPWPLGDPHVVAAVAAFGVQAHLEAVLDAEEAKWEGDEADDIFGNLRAALLEERS